MTASGLTVVGKAALPRPVNQGSTSRHVLLPRYLFAPPCPASVLPSRPRPNRARRLGLAVPVHQGHARRARRAHTQRPPARLLQAHLQAGAGGLGRPEQLPAPHCSLSLLLAGGLWRCAARHLPCAAVLVVELRSSLCCPAPAGCCSTRSAPCLCLMAPLPPSSAAPPPPGAGGRGSRGGSFGGECVRLAGWVQCGAQPSAQRHSWAACRLLPSLRAPISHLPARPPARPRCSVEEKTTFDIILAGGASSRT